jgi:hypothetical protein
VRFVYGTYRFHEQVEEGLEHWLRLWNAGATLIVFVLFYVAGLCVRNPQPFYASLIIVHGWALIWYGVVLRFSTRMQNLRSVMLSFIVLDVITVITLFLVLYFFPNHARSLGLGFMVALAAIDIGLNWKFFFHQLHCRIAVRGIKSERRHRVDPVSSDDFLTIAGPAGGLAA